MLCEDGIVWCVPERQLVISAQMLIVFGKRILLLVTNGGGIRANIPAGEITSADLFAVHPLAIRFAW